LSYFVASERFEHLTSLDGSGDAAELGQVQGDIYISRDIPVDRLEVTEGSLLIVASDQLAAIEADLTPTARFGVRAFSRQR
jgi:8-oxo-dGTP diphosphatase